MSNFALTLLVILLVDSVLLVYAMGKKKWVMLAVTVTIAVILDIILVKYGK